MAGKKVKKASPTDAPASRRELDYKRSRAEQIAATVRTVARSAAVVGCVWLAKDALVAFAGKTTVADVSAVVRFLLHVTFDRWAAYAIAIVASIYGLGQRKLRKRTIERLTGRITQYESEADPARTSSELTETGETNPGDRT